MSQAKLDLIPRENCAIAIAPDIAVEVISDSEQPDDMEEKLRDYLEADVEVWQVFPSVQSVTRWRGNQGIRLEGNQALTSEHLPGLSMSVSDVFST